jgi:hypothetical protein
VIGGTGENGVRSCSCFSNETDAKSDTDVMGTVVVSQPKICCVCGKDVTGKKRAKDSRGYWCYDCHKAERKREKEAETSGKVRCPTCSRWVLPGAIVNFEDQKMCMSCKNARMEAHTGRKKFKEVGDKHYDAHNRQRVLIMGVVLIVLLAIILISRMHH